MLDDLTGHAEQLQTIQRIGLFWLIAFDDLLETGLQPIKIDLLVLPEGARLAQLQGKGLGIQLLVGKGSEGNRRLALQQHGLHARRTQPRQFATRMLATFLERIQCELFDLRATNGGVQVVVQARTPRHAEEGLGKLLQLSRPQGFTAAGQLVPAIEQAIDVLLDIPLSLANRFGVAEQEQDTGARLDFSPGNAMQQLVEQFDRCSFIAMDAGR
ncbi:hypothetical protein D3C80_1287000 [compost metagenome]